MKNHLILAFALLLVCTGLANAQVNNPFADGTSLGTPDGITPAEETVCDGLTGAAYGLCTAYCEAMDCDSGSPQASQTACSRVASKFEQINGGGLPCGCPCVGRIEDYIEALNGDFGLVACVEVVIPDVADLMYLVTDEISTRYPGSLVSDVYGSYCGFTEIGGAFLTITSQEAAACNALVRRKAAEAGLTCTTQGQG